MIKKLQVNISTKFNLSLLLISIVSFFCLNTITSQTIELINIYPGEESGYEKGIIFNDHIYFVGNNGEGAGVELMRTDGTEGGTTLVKDINPGAADTDFGDFYIHNNLLIFRVVVGNNMTEVYRSDGTEDGTFKIDELFIGTLGADRMVSFGDYLYYIKLNLSLDVVLHRTDGAVGGNVSLGVEGMKPGMFVYNDLMYFTGSVDGIQGLYSMSLDEDFTLLIPATADDGTPSISEGRAQRIGDDLFYIMSPSSAGKTLHKYNIATGENQLLIDPTLNPVQNVNHIHRFNDKIAFVATLPDTGIELWVSDGTVEGTNVLEINTSMGMPNGINFTLEGETLGDLFVFVGQTNEEGEELWATDGTPAGTFLLKDIREGNADSDPSSFIRRGNNLFFSALNPESGRELWMTDGTVEGTQLFVDIVEGSPSGNPSEFLIYNSCLYFRGIASDGGFELYKICDPLINTFEKEANTIAVNLFPNPSSSSGEINIGFPTSFLGEHVNLTVFSLDGRKVFSQQIITEENNTINFQQPLVGNFLIAGRNDKGKVIFTKLINRFPLAR